MCENNKKEIIICPRCSGTGFISWTERVSAYDDETIYNVCPMCNGHRVIKKKIEIVYEPVSENEVDLTELLKNRLFKEESYNKQKCDHDFEHEGNDSHRDYYKCKKCGYEYFI